MDNPLPSLDSTTFKLHTTKRQYDMQYNKLVVTSSIQKNNTLQSIYNNHSLSPTTCIDTETEIRVDDDDVAGFVEQQLGEQQLGNHASRLLPLMNRGEMVVKVIELKRNITNGRERLPQRTDFLDSAS